MKRLTILLLVQFGLSLGAIAQIGGPPPSPHLVSIDLSTNEAKTIFTGKIDEFSIDTPEYSGRDVTVSVTDTLKGVPGVRFRGRLPLSLESVTLWRQRSSLLLFFLPAKLNEVTVIDLSNPDLAVLTAAMNVLRKPGEILDAIRRQISRAQKEKDYGKHTIDVPAEKIAGSSLTKPYHKDFRYAPLDVPIDDRLERYAISRLHDRDVDLRLKALQALRFFKSDANIRRVKPLLLDPSYSIWQTASDHRGLEVHEFYVRRAAFELLSSWGVRVDQPADSETISRLATIDSLQVSSLKPDEDIGWLTGAKMVKSLAFSYDPPLTRPQIAVVGQLNTLTSLTSTVGGIDDRDLKALTGLKRLRTLTLDSNPITDDGVVALAGFPNLTTVSLVNTEVTNAGLDALRKARPNLNVLPLAAGSIINEYARNGNLDGVRRVLARHPAAMEERDVENLPSYSGDARAATAGNTPLHNAALYGRVEIVRLLLESGAKVDALNDRLETPLWLAALTAWNNVPILKLLLSYGADLNHVDIDGRNPLHAVLSQALGDYGGAIRLMIDAGANPFAKDKKGALPYDLEQSKNGIYLDQVRALIDSMKQSVPLIPQTNARCDRAVYTLSGSCVGPWSNRDLGKITGQLQWSKSPAGRGYLGPFGQQAVTLELAGLAKHNNVELDLDLWVIGSWDGNGGLGAGPDIIDIRIPGIGTALHSTFFQCAEGDASGMALQSFPDPYPGGFHKAYTGAVEVNTLGFPDFGVARTARRNAVYRLHFTFAHSAPDLQFVITGMNVVQDYVRTLLEDEHWGIGNLVVKTD